MLRVAHLIHGCTTLGPGARTVVWVRGCARRCPGCVAAPILDEGAALQITAEELVSRVLATPDEGVTLSGGEPFEQAGALLPVARALQAAGRSVMIYSGHTLDQLRAHPDPQVARLLAAADVLVDGPFEQGQRADLLWRGSANQQIHLLTARYQHLAAELGRPGLGVEVRVDREGRLFWAGVPPVGFVAGLRQAAENRGIILASNGDVWA